jgi:peptidoglycan/xylan/chitin deacetylase (PgdA/CDA1 family)
MIPILFIIPGLIILCLLWLVLNYSFLIPGKKGLAILMYHKVSEDKADELTIPVATLDQQLMYIREKGYSCITFKELDRFVSAGDALPEKPLILTFDDAYGDFYTYALPLLRKYNLRATVFVPVGFMGRTNTWDLGEEPLMGPDILKELADEGIIETGLHSYLHRNYNELSPAEMKTDLEDCMSTLDSYKIPFFPVLAYPYGGYPKKDPARFEVMKALFRDSGIRYAVRIGNRINPVPLYDPYEIKRTDIRGTDSFLTFRIKLKKGRKRLFS